MKVKIQQYLFGKNHSWSIVGQNIGRSLLKLGHNVHFVSTDGIEEKYTPTDLKDHIRKEPEGDNYDMQISYTAPYNWPSYLKHGSKNRFAIWNYEYNNKPNAQNLLLSGFGKYRAATDLSFPSSNFSKEVFRSMGVPDHEMVVIPHGIHLKDFEDKTKWPLKTNKKYKILLNIAQPHKRKALHLALEAFGKAFNKTDDVCLVAKVFTSNKKNGQFDVDWDKIYNGFRRKFKNHAEVEIIKEYIPNITHLYNSCDINYSATFAECWHLPSLEALAAGLVNVVPRYGGQLDFCYDDNSVLINGEIVRAPRDHQYWNHNPFAVHFKIDVNDAAQKLKQTVLNYDQIKKEKLPEMQKTAVKFTWDNAVKKILEVTK